jgi:hypothetical protein
VASVIGKRQGDRTYYYLAETARVDGRPRIVAQRYLGQAEDIAAAVAAARPAAGGAAPLRARRLPFGDVAAVWHTLRRLDLVGIVDAAIEAEGPPWRGAPSAGTLLALAVLRRAAATSATEDATSDDVTTDDIATWWTTNEISRVVRSRGTIKTAPTERQVDRALRALTPARLDRIERALHARLIEEFELTGPALAIDLPAALPNFAGVSAANWGVGLLVAADGAVPLAAVTYRQPQADDAPTAGAAVETAGFADVLQRLTSRHAKLCGETQLTVVLEPHRRAQHALAAAAGVPFIGSVPLTDHAELAALPSSAFRAVDASRLPGVSAVDTRARVSGVERRVVVVRSESSRVAAERAFAGALRTATRQLDDLAAALASAAPPSRADTANEIARITAPRRLDRVLTATLTTTADRAMSEARRGEGERARLTWRVDEAAYARVRAVFGRQLLVTDRLDWPLAELLIAYRARGRLAGTFELLDRPARGGAARDGASDAGRLLLGVLATTVTHLMRREAQRHGIDLSARDLLDRLRGLTETRVVFPSTGGRPPSRRVLDEPSPTERGLFELFELSRYAPAEHNSTA